MNTQFRPVLAGPLLGVIILVYAEFMVRSCGLYAEDIKGALYEENSGAY